MKAIPEHQRLLLDLAEIDAAKDRLQQTAKRLPEQQHLNRMHTERSAKRAEIVKLTGALEATETEAKRVRDDIAVVNARIARDESKIADSADGSTTVELKRELDTLARRSAVLSETEAALREQELREKAALHTAQEQLRSLETETADLESRREQAVASLRDEAKRNAKERAALTEKIPAELVALYDERRARNGIGASLLVGNVTSATGVRLDPGLLNTIRRADPDEVIICPDSGGVLVRPFANNR